MDNGFKNQADTNVLKPQPSLRLTNTFLWSIYFQLELHSGVVVSTVAHFSTFSESFDYILHCRQINISLGLFSKSLQLFYIEEQYS